MKVLILAALYNGVWAAAVFGGAAGMQWPGVAAAAAFVLVLAWMRGGADLRWLLFLLVCGLYGTVADGFLTQLGLMHFPESPEAWPLPAWMPALWVGFAGLLGPVFRFLRGRPVLAATLGALAGPITYLGATRFGAVEMAPGWVAPLCVAVEWTVFMPLALCRASREPELQVAA